MNLDQLKGRFKRIRGKLLEWAGVITSNEELKNDGGSLEKAGKSQTAYGDVKSELKRIWAMRGH
jgi:uncharacterized protein YjbJ (UPF0337 family)